MEGDRAASGGREREGDRAAGGQEDKREGDRDAFRGARVGAAEFFDDYGALHAVAAMYPRGIYLVLSFILSLSLSLDVCMYTFSFFF